MIISISGTPGAGKTTIAKELSRKLKYKHYSVGSIMDRIAKQKKMYIEDLAAVREKDDSIDKEVDEYQIGLGKKKENFVIDSRLGFYFIPNSFKIFLFCDIDVAVGRIFKNQRAAERTYKTKAELKKALRKRILQDKRIYKKLYGIDNFYDKKHFNLSVDTSKLTVKEIISRIQKGI